MESVPQNHELTETGIFTSTSTKFHREQKKIRGCPCTSTRNSFQSVRKKRMRYDEFPETTTRGISTSTPTKLHGFPNSCAGFHGILGITKSAMESGHQDYT